MKKHFFTLITIAALLVPGATSSVLAQTRQGASRSNATSGSASNPAGQVRTHEEVRASLLKMVDSVENLSALLSTYIVGRNALKNSGFESDAQLLADLAGYRKRILALPPEALAVLAGQQSGYRAMIDLTNVVNQMRDNPSVIRALDRAEAQLSRQPRKTEDSDSRSPGTPSEESARGGVSAVSYIKPGCDFRQIGDYPAPSDIAIAKGFSLAADTATMILIPNIEIPVPVIGGVIKIPNPAKIIAAVAWGVAEEVVNGLEAAREDAKYCEALAFTILGSISNDDPATISLVLRRSQGGFNDFVGDLVEAVIDLASADGVKINCARAELAAARSLVLSNKLMDAFKKYRIAYQNVGAEKCPDGN